MISSNYRDSKREQDTLSNTKVNCNQSLSPSSDSGISIIHHSSINPLITRNGILICATYGRIYAIHKKSGENLWMAEYPTNTFYGSTASVFITDQDSVLVATNSKASCLDLFNSTIKWGSDVYDISVICTPSRVLILQNTLDEALPNCHNDNEDNGKRIPILVITRTHGKCIGYNVETGQGCGKELYRLDASTGKLRWEAKLSPIRAPKKQA
ncbi:hypothetical protein BDA99DRAFT_558437 [Phascolomyces articulosus]|uniref:Uncharacterized protein n=1 Tax=Phascolomyces articulosus TaxID=60185 RepID=A0AAD5KE56_9FUNG|nr:hypothetical protein BDA99DRAFT_558437 [Phascolomyces articulosus]